MGAETIHARLGDQVIDYLNWAETYVDQLDPLASRTRSVEFTSGAGSYMSDLDRIKAAYGRLIGGQWEEAWKVPDPKGNRHYYYSKSVFEVDDIDEEANGQANTADNGTKGA